MNQPQVLKGFRDFLPTEKRARDYVLRCFVSVFEQYGFEPIETPTLEYRETIMGKYGEEADKLVYQFMDNGDREVALRYDQTVPTARFIANHFGDINFPFRRYQTQNVFRADKPQKGRFREFTQCDIDIFGSADPVSDAEIIACVYAAYKAVGFGTVQIQINDRQTLVSALEPFAMPGISVFSIIQSIDKLDKLPPDEVIAELVRKGMRNVQAAKTLETLKDLQPSGNLEQVISLAQDLGVSEAELVFNPALARGLDYYTGMIYEVLIPEYTVGSVGGGGRYDNLIKQLSGIQMTATGGSFGFDRTVEAAKQLGLIPTSSDQKSLLVSIFDEKLLGESTKLAAKLRAEGLSVEMYPKNDKLSKQFKFADKKGIRYVAILGSIEIENNQVALRDMQTGEQEVLSVKEVVEKLKV